MLRNKSHIFIWFLLCCSLLSLSCSMWSDNDEGINVTIQNLGGPYSIDVAYTDNDGDATTPEVINALENMTVTFRSDYDVATNPGYDDIMDGSSTIYPDYYITSYTIDYAVSAVSNNTVVTMNSLTGGCSIHIRNGDTFTTDNSTFQIVTEVQRDILTERFSINGSMYVVGTITFNGEDESGRAFALVGSLNINFDEYAPPASSS